MRRNAQRQSAEETTARRVKMAKIRRTAKMVATVRSRRRSLRESQESQDSQENQESQEVKMVSAVKARASAVVPTVKVAEEEDREEAVADAVAEAAVVPTAITMARDTKIPVEIVETAVVREVATTHGREEKARTVNQDRVAAAAETQDPPAPRPMASSSETDRRESLRPQEVMVRESHTVVTVVTAVAEVEEEAEVVEAAVVVETVHPAMLLTHQSKPRIDNSEEVTSTIVEPQSEVTP